jgi:CRP/FNR family transcriptional regulator, cyclic AMP receptor protein
MPRAKHKDNAGPTGQSLLLRLPGHFLTQLFGRAPTVRLKTGEPLFLVGDTGDGCYRLDDGLLKVTMVSRTGKERILAFLGPGAIVGEMSIIDRLPRRARTESLASFRSQTRVGTPPL